MSNNPDIDGGSHSSLSKADKQIIQVGCSIIDRPPSPDDDTIGYAPKCLVAATLPYRNPKPEQLINGCWVRTNGEYSLIVQGGVRGLPYGKYPRIFSLWLTEEAKKSGSRRLHTGGSFKDFCRKVGIDPSRGKRGSGSRMIDQIDRFLSSRVAFRYESKSHIRSPQLQIADDYELFWQPKNPDQIGIFESYIELTEKFYDEITTHVIPHDRRAVAVLKPFALDIYLWLANRYYYLKRPTRPTWDQLAMQFGGSQGNDKRWRYQFKIALKEVKAVYHEARFDVTDAGLTLFPSKTPVQSNINIFPSSRKKR